MRTPAVFRIAFGFAAFVPALAALSASPGCGSNNKGNGCPPGPDLCASYCQHAFSTVCGWDTDFLTCANACRASGAMLPAECKDAWETALSCSSCASIQCAQRTCTPDGTVCIDEGSKVIGCDEENAAVLACGGACLQGPATSFSGGGSPDGGTLSNEIVTSRCACPATLQPGAGAGAACVTAGDCAQVCCPCAAGHGKFLVRSCANGQCLGEADACAAGADDFLVTSFCGG